MLLQKIQKRLANAPSTLPESNGQQRRLGSIEFSNDRTSSDQKALVGHRRLAPQAPPTAAHASGVHRSLTAELDAPPTTTTTNMQVPLKLMARLKERSN